MDVNGDEPKQVSGISVTLRDINLFTTGLFGCEASAEESFHTALVRKQMTVLGNENGLLEIQKILLQFFSCSAMNKDAFLNKKLFINFSHVQGPKASNFEYDEAIQQ